jgi:hypothetical protein
MRTSTTKTKTRIAALTAFLCLIFALSSFAEKKKGTPSEYAIVGGTVFQESGIAQPGAKVVLAAKDQPGKKLQEQISSSRGEFAFRVPPGPLVYIVTATFKGFEPASKEVPIEAQEQVHKSLLLVPTSK